MAVKEHGESIENLSDRFIGSICVQLAMASEVVA
jgi:hypothetical protein